jgi:hypothetical protein
MKKRIYLTNERKLRFNSPFKNNKLNNRKFNRSLISDYNSGMSNDIISKKRSIFN